MNLNKYIDFNYKKFDIVFYIAVLFLLASHTLHILDGIKYLFVFQILFIISYLSFIVLEYREKKKVNIVNLLFRGAIIIMALTGIYKQLYLLL